MATSLLFRDEGRVSLTRPCDRFAERTGLGVTVSMPMGRMVVIEGEPINECFRVVSGSLRCYKTVIDGRRQIINFLGPNDCFGLTGLANHAFSVEAITDVVMIRYPRHRVDAVIDDEPELGQDLFRLACAELHQAQRHLLLLGRKNADERLATFLLSLAEQQGDHHVHLAMSRQDIADHLGLTIETVSRLFTRFRNMGLVSLPHRHSVILADIERLEAMAEGSLAA